MFDTVAIHLALRERLKTVALLPAEAQRAYENKAFTPTTGQAFLEEDFVPATNTLLTTATNGVMEMTGLYVVRYYGAAGSGITDIRRVSDEILAAFPVASFPALPNGDVLRVRGDLAPWAGQITRADQGRAVVTITIPWRCHSTNTAFSLAS